MLTIVNKLATCGVITALLWVPATPAAEHVGDGEVKSVRLSQDREDANPACLSTSHDCPAFPQTLAFSPAEIEATLKGQALCVEAGEAIAEDDRLAPLLKLSAMPELARAIANVMLTRPGLQLHDLKIGIQLLAELNTDTALASLDQVYKDSHPLVERIVLRNMRQANEDELAAFVSSQAADLRRHVVLAVAGDPRAATLLNAAREDADRSVARAADKALGLRLD